GLGVELDADGVHADRPAALGGGGDERADDADDPAPRAGEVSVHDDRRHGHDEHGDAGGAREFGAFVVVAQEPFGDEAGGPSGVEHSGDEVGGPGGGEHGEHAADGDGAPDDRADRHEDGGGEQDFAEEAVEVERQPR